LNQVFLELLHAFGILLVALLAKLSDALHKLGRVDFVGHGGRQEDARWSDTGRLVLREGNESRGMRAPGSEW
jgi:hypothetical protein